VFSGGGVVKGDGGEQRETKRETENPPCFIDRKKKRSLSKSRAETKKHGFVSTVLPNETVPRAFPSVHIVRLDHGELLANHTQLARDPVLGAYVLRGVIYDESYGAVVSEEKNLTVFRKLGRRRRHRSPAATNRSS
jgi:hypothetical protein